MTRVNVPDEPPVVTVGLARVLLPMFVEVAERELGPDWRERLPELDDDE